MDLASGQFLHCHSRQPPSVCAQTFRLWVQPVLLMLWWQLNIYQERSPYSLDSHTSPHYIYNMLKKLPIQRLERVRNESRRMRTARACETCRQRRTKCDGSRPMCAQCDAQGLVNCVYTDNKTARGRMQLQSAELKNASYEEFLREISRGANTSLAERIARILEVRIDIPYVLPLQYRIEYSLN